MQKLNWILNCDDVVVLRLINQIDNCGQSRTLATSGRACHQDNPVFDINNLPQLWRQIEIRKVRRLRRYYAHYDGVAAALLKDIHAKAGFSGNAEREVSRPGLVYALGSTLIISDN